MAIYKIAGLRVSMECCYTRTMQQSEAYCVNWERSGKEEPVQIRIAIPKKKIEEYTNTHRQLNEDNWEYMLTGAEFYMHLLEYDGLMLHASAVVVDGKAYLFSADSGTGKSTHTALWCQYFGERAFIINDDKPAVRLIDGKFYVFGTPWSGKTDQNVNTCAELGGIVFLERSEENWIRPADSGSVVPKLIKQTSRKLRSEYLERMLVLADRLLSSAAVYEMGCNISEEAVVMAYEAMTL